MDGQLKFYLLAETGGWDCSAYAFAYRTTILQSDAYQVLSLNVLQAKKHLSTIAQDIVNQYENMKIEPKTLSEAFVLETKIEYLALHSFPEFYLNPLAIDPNYNSEVTSIGELMFDFKGGEVPLNQIILDETVSLEDKKELVDRKLDDFLGDMNNLVSISIQTVQKRAFAKENEKNSQELFSTLLGIFSFVVMQVIFFFMLVIDNPFYYASYYDPQPQYVTSYTVFMLPISILLFDVIYSLFHIHKARISEPFMYARRFLKRYQQQVYDDILNKKRDLYDYICGAINTKIILKDDIKDFSKLSSSYIDFKEVINVSSLKERKSYRILQALTYVFGTIAWIVLLISLSVFIISKAFGGRI